MLRQELAAAAAHLARAARRRDFATSDLPSVAAARDAYEALRTERDRVAAVHAAYDAYEYHTIHTMRKCAGERLRATAACAV